MPNVGAEHLETVLRVLEEVSNDYRWTHTEGREILKARDAIHDSLRED